MKSIREIEKLSEEDLGRIAVDTSIRVPETLEDDMRKVIGSLSLADEDSDSRQTVTLSWVRPLAAAASLALLVAAGASLLGREDTLQDTYSDPAAAYAQLEASLGKISSKMNQGLSRAQEAGAEAREITNQALGI